MSKREDILRRAAVLLRMTVDRGATEAEAATAAAKVQELADLYSIDLGDLQEEERRQRIADDISEARCLIPWKQVPRSIVMLMNVVAKGFNCRVFTSRTIGGSDAVFCGFSSDAVLAEFLFSVLSRQLPREAKRSGRNLRLRRRKLTVYVHSFTIGAAVRIAFRLAERRPPPSPDKPSTTSAVVCISKAVAIDGYLSGRYRIVTSPGRLPRRSPTRMMGTLHGMAHGSSVPLQTALVS